MKLEFKAKYLQYLLKKNEKQGFSWIDLLVIVIIFGILAAIALYSLLSQTVVRSGPEAKQNLGALNRAQQAYFLENHKFSDSISELAVGMKTETLNYRYRIISPPKNGLFQKLHGTVFPPSLNDAAIMIAQSKNPKNKSYVGVVSTIPGDVSTSEPRGFLCETEKPTTIISTVPVPTFHKDERGNQYLGCPKGYKDLGAKRP